VYGIAAIWGEAFGEYLGAPADVSGCLDLAEEWLPAAEQPSPHYEVGFAHVFKAMAGRAAFRNLYYAPARLGAEFRE